MTAAAEKAPGIKLSSNFVAVEGEPLTGVDLLSACEGLDGDIVKAGLHLSENGGAKRTRIRPVIKSVGDASAVEVADQLHAIAWADCMQRSESSRYVAELTDGEGTTHRVYFNLEPPNDVAHDTGSTEKPSLEYVRGLENLVLNMTRDNNRTAQRHQMTEAKRIDTAWAGISRGAQTEVARGRVEVERLEVQGRIDRNDKILGGVVSLLPKLADKYLPPGPGDVVAALASSDEAPVERVKKLVRPDQFEAFEKSLGDLWKPFCDAKGLEEARVLLADMSQDQQAAVLEAIGRDNIVTIATWK